MLPLAVAWFPSDVSAISYAHPVLRMTSSFHVMEQMGHSQRRPACFIEIAKWRHKGRSCCLQLHPILFCSCNRSREAAIILLVLTRLQLLLAILNKHFETLLLAEL